MRDKITPTPSDFIPYPEIGKGAQFRAFDMHNGRVLKLPLTEAETYIVARERRNTTGDNGEVCMDIAERVLTFINGKARIPAMINHTLDNNKAFLNLLSNPELAKDYLPEDTPTKRWGAGRVTYTQDKILMNHEVFYNLQMHSHKSHGRQRLHQMIDAYVQSTYLLWDYGYADYVFKFGDTGFNSQGQLSFVDLGEFSSDLGFMTKAIEQRRWRNNVDPCKADFPQIPIEVQGYFMSALEEAFTPDILQKRWRQKHTCQECLARDDIINTFISAKVAEIDYIDRW